MVKRFLISLGLSAIFFWVAFLTLADYNISWDEILHFSRGQAYVRYFLTGKLDYQGLPQLNLQGTFGKPNNTSSPRRSFFQLTDFHNGEHYVGMGGGGHPPISDVLAAASNYLFFQKLGILDDIPSYHLYNILASSLLVFVVVFFAMETLGIFPATISFLALTTYPLFFGESHFNIKDFTLAAFFAGFVWAFYKSLKGYSLKWLTISILFFSFALGTKFNIIFAVPIVALYYIYSNRTNFIKAISSIPKKYFVLLVLAPFISLAILTAFWPFLWHNWFVNFGKVISFYREIGAGINYQPQGFYLAGFNLFPILWILFTTPPVTLIFLIIGIIAAFFNRKTQDSVFILLLLWFLIPIIRVTFPGSSIYGGIRQISEFVPAMALLAGLGAWQINKWFRGNKVVLALILLTFVWPVFIIVKLHPNENVYFNFLIGGLRGASERNFPSWGNSLGNAYLQGIKWINKNAPDGAKLALIQGTPNNLPSILARKDISYKSFNFSGIERQGEYLMELTFNDTAREFDYKWNYVNRFLDPVYEVKVDGVAILKVWKNDWEHTKSEFRLKETKYTSFKFAVSDNQINLMFDDEITLSRINFLYKPTPNCQALKESFIEISPNGKDWLREKDNVPARQLYNKLSEEGNVVNFFFAGDKTRFLRLISDSQNPCVLNIQKVEIKVLN